MTESNYHSIPRKTLIAEVPRGTRRVLDLGCGTGATLDLLRENGVEYTAGIEMDFDAFSKVSGNHHAVYSSIECVIGGSAGRWEDYIKRWYAKPFDVIICGDILEHLAWPGETLRWLHRGILRTGGVIIASVPNVGYVRSVGALAAQDATYRGSGIWDETHLRFFCKKNVGEMFEIAGYEVKKLETLLRDPDIPKWSKTDGFMTMGPIHIQVKDEAHHEELATYQWLCVAERPTEGE